jgi:hypothetical protein
MYFASTFLTLNSVPTYFAAMRPSLPLPLAGLSPRAAAPALPSLPSSRATGASAASPGTGRWEDTAAALIAHYGAVATAVLPWLHVSGEHPACDGAVLRRLGVGLIVNTAGEVVRNAFEGAGGSGGGAPAVAYLTLALRDGPSEDVWCLFASVCRAIDAARAAGSASLLCCHMGISRSASFAIAYLMWAGALPLREAYAFVRALRPVVSPNPGFTCQLLEWQAHLALLRGGALPPPLLFRLRALMPGCSASGALLRPPPVAAAAPVADGRAAPEAQPIACTHALTLARAPADRALVAPLPAALAELGSAGEALLVCRFADAGAPRATPPASRRAAACELLLPAGCADGGAALRARAGDELRAWTALCAAGGRGRAASVRAAMRSVCAARANAALAEADCGEGNNVDADVATAEGEAREGLLRVAAFLDAAGEGAEGGGAAEWPVTEWTLSD